MSGTKLPSRSALERTARCIIAGLVLSFPTGCFVVPAPSTLGGGESSVGPSAVEPSAQPVPANADVADGEPVRLEIRVRLPERFRGRFVETWGELREAARTDEDYIGTSLAETVTTDPVPELVAVLEWRGLDSLRAFVRSQTFVRIAKELPGSPEVVLRRVLTDLGDRNVGGSGAAPRPASTPRTQAPTP